jgi:hypothetical protein
MAIVTNDLDSCASGMATIVVQAPRANSSPLQRRRPCSGQRTFRRDCARIMPCRTQIVLRYFLSASHRCLP